MSDFQSSVCIAIPCYNHGNFIADTIKSIIQQSFLNIELIVIDDGSTDDSASRIRELVPLCEARFFRFEFRTRCNRGVCATLNEALAWCESEYFAPIASDDVLKSHKTALQVAYLAENTGCAGVFGAVEIIGEDGQVLHRPNSIRIHKCKKYRFRDIFMHMHNLPAPAQMLRSKALRDIGGYVEGLVIEDWSLWLLLTQSGYTLDYINDTVACYRQHERNTSSKFDLMLDGRMQILDRFRRNDLYEQALARVYLIDALDRQMFELVRSVRSVRLSLNLDLRVVWTPMFLKYLIRIPSMVAKFVFH